MPAWLIDILAQFGERFMEWLAGIAEAQVEAILAKQHQSGIDDDNAQKYQDAKTRADRIRAATNLLNGIESP